MTIAQAKQWMRDNGIGTDYEQWRERHPDFYRHTDVAQTFDKIAPDWRGEMKEAA